MRPATHSQLERLHVLYQEGKATDDQLEELCRNGAISESQLEQVKTGVIAVEPVEIAIAVADGPRFLLPDLEHPWPRACVPTQYLVAVLCWGTCGFLIYMWIGFSK